MDVAIARENERLTKGLNFPRDDGRHGAVRGPLSARSGASCVRFRRSRSSGNTSLAVVAPGIAEALLATGLGLLAAIPAVIFYNKLSSDADSLIGSYEGFADEFSTLLSRQLD